MKRIQKKSQIGRSMTEMLGVLAIIGVLSVAAVSGYRNAITRHKTNDLIEDVKLAGFLVTADDMIKNLPEFDAQENGPALNLQGKFTPKTSYDFWVFKESPETYAIVALDVEENVCREAVTRKTDWLEEIRANGTENKCHDANDNDMSFFFNINLNKWRQEEFCRWDTDCGECGVCKNKQCTYENAPLPARAEFNPNSSLLCVACDYSKYGGAIRGIFREECLRCSNRFYEESSEGTGKCHLCNSTGTIFSWVRKEDCLACGNRVWTTYAGKKATDGEQLGSCAYCTGTVSANGTQCITE